MAKRKPVTRGEGGPNPPPLGQVYPAIARWASGDGRVEFGIEGLDHPFVRALDEGGRVWEGEGKSEMRDKALLAMEVGLTGFMAFSEIAWRPGSRSEGRLTELTRSSHSGGTGPVEHQGAEAHRRPHVLPTAAPRAGRL